MSELKVGEIILIPIAKKKKMFTIVEKDGVLFAHHKEYGYIRVDQLKVIERRR